MSAQSTFPCNSHVVNVASIPDLSPFRYPGGKTWLVPCIRQWLGSKPRKPSLFVEPFVGGAIVSLTVANEDLASHVVMVELDSEVAAVWETILNAKNGGRWLANKITEFKMNSTTVEHELAKSGLMGRSLAFQTILKNRVNRGGILAAGAGLINRGENDKGLGSRWYPVTLQRRILDILKLRNKITFNRGDGLEAIRQRVHNSNTVFFIDPPYTAAGKKTGARLYTHHEIDHNELFRVVSTLSGDFLMTYNDSSVVRRLADSYGFQILSVTMKNTHHKKQRELIIGRDLSWYE